MKSYIKIASLCLYLTSASACATLNRSSVVATADVPETAAVQEVSIPYDASAPRFVVAVEPFSMSQQSTVETDISGYNRCADGNCTISTSVKNLGTDVSSQLITALTKAGNISVLDFSALKKNHQGEYSARIAKNESGPYLIRGTLTEFSEAIESSDEDHGVHLGWIGLVAGIAGAVAGKPGLGWAGAGVAAANPSFESESKHRKGMVAFDLQIIDAKSMRVIGAHRVVGTFAAESAYNGFGLFGVSGSKHEFAQSVLGQAMRVAMNDALTKIWGNLRQRA